MRTMQTNVVNYLIDYRSLIGLQAHEFEVLGFTKRSDHLKGIISSINQTLTVFSTFCDANIRSPLPPLAYNPYFDRRK